MGVFTEQMSHLCGEIRSLRGARHAFIRELARETKHRCQMVHEMCGSFSRAHAAAARNGRAERHAFLSALRHEVARQRQEFRADMAGARRAWAGQKA